MLAFWTFLISISWNQIVAFIAVATFVAGALYKAKPLVTLTCRAGRALLTLQDTLDAIEHELKPNSGSSLRDAVNRIENSLGRQQVMIRAIVDNQDIPILELLADGRAVWASPAMLSLLDLAEGQVVDYGWTSVVDQSQRQQLIGEVTLAATQEREFSFVTHIRSQPVSLRGQPAKAGSRVQGFICVII